jgi:dihydroneopterin aldolase
MPIIALEGMQFFAHHGLYAYEQEHGNTFMVDVWLDLGETALPDSDEVSDAVDYTLIYQAAADAMKVRVNLLETLVLRISQGLESLIPHWKSVRIRVSKMDPPVEGIAARSYVEETFHRKG